MVKISKNIYITIILLFNYVGAPNPFWYLLSEDDQIPKNIALAEDHYKHMTHNAHQNKGYENLDNNDDIDDELQNNHSGTDSDHSDDQNNLLY